MICRITPIDRLFHTLHVTRTFYFFRISPMLTISYVLAIYSVFRTFRLGSFQVSFREVTDSKESPGSIENRAT